MCWGLPVCSPCECTRVCSCKATGSVGVVGGCCACCMPVNSSPAYPSVRPHGRELTTQPSRLGTSVSCPSDVTSDSHEQLRASSRTVYC